MQDRVNYVGKIRLITYVRQADPNCKEPSSSSHTANDAYRLAELHARAKGGGLKGLHDGKQQGSCCLAMERGGVWRAAAAE